MALAEKTGGVIVNADSAQVYCELPILSAAPTAADRERAEHRLYGTVNGAEPCSAADWARMAKEQIADVQQSGRLPILAGGTGLYLRTLLQGIAPVPPIDPDIRDRVRARPVEENRDELQRIDPTAADRLNPADSARIARALEVVLSTGRSLHDWQARRKGGIAGEMTVKAAILLPPRPWLYARCDARFEAMIEAGAIGEVERLLELGLDPELPVMRAIGVRRNRRLFVRRDRAR